MDDTDIAEAGCSKSYSPRLAKIPLMGKFTLSFLCGQNLEIIQFQ